MTTVLKPYYSDEFSLMLPLSGENNGTVFNDASDRPKPLARFGDVKTVTAQSKWYGSSAYFDGNGDYFTFDDHADFDLSVSDFTLDAWFNRLSNTGNALYGCLISKRLSGANWDWGIEMNVGTRVNFKFGDTTGNVRALIIGEAQLNTWNHVAISRQGSTLKTYLNGQLGGTATISGAIRNRTSAGRHIGRSLTSYADNQFHGYMNDLRLIKGESWIDGPFDHTALGPGLVDGVLSRPREGFAVNSSLIDLRGIAAPRVTLFNWDDPTHYAQCLPGPDDQWSLTVPPGLKYGLYYLSQDNRCPPIIHGPYTAE